MTAAYPECARFGHDHTDRENDVGSDPVDALAGSSAAADVPLTEIRGTRRPGICGFCKLCPWLCGASQWAQIHSRPRRAKHLKFQNILKYKA